MISFLDFWGSGNVRMRRLAPSTRIACGAVIFASCLISPMHKPLDVFFIGGAIIGWVLLCGVPWKSIAGLSLYASLLFLPLFLLIPWMVTHPSTNNHWFAAARVPLGIGIRGTACIFICASTIAILDLAEFDMGLRNLPIPRAITMLISQIVHQTAMLTNESRRISFAVKVRGLPSGYMARLRILPALPTIWLLRIMNRAERIAAAMELRGFEITPQASCESSSCRDVFAIATAILLLGTVIAIRWVDVI
ncbi:MAG: hypothetical protein A2283_12630 [Lentisphaerae bacterium RIFOXYA12_FULL_48_11]|nr:MAG: hypothetical protein A2283_12630 [Lentisphaerae bacterium RIFOXYA12_FULL_48_11]